MPYKRIGFFFELSPDVQRKQLNELRKEEPHVNESQILDYLSSGVDAGVAMIVEHDVLKEPPKPLGEAVLRSDGEWIWPASLAYYVREYHLELPSDFIRKMKDQNWQIPSSVKFTPEIPEGHIEM